MSKLLGNVQWRKHWIGLLVFSLALLLLLWAWWLRLGAQESLALAPAIYGQQQSTNTSAAEALDILNNNLQTYRYLQEKGVIGQPRRLQWLETLQQLSEQYQLPDIQFSLGVTQAVTQENSPYWNPEIAMKMTQMRLDFKLLHEGDFYRLLAGLQGEAQGLFSIEQCAIEQELGEHNARIGLIGFCELRWYSLQDVVAHWETPS